MVKHGVFKSFFLHPTVIEWNNLDYYLRNAPSSSIEFEIIRTILSQCIIIIIFFFLQKHIARTKTLTNKNQLKNKNKLTLNNKATVFCAYKLLRS